MAMLVSVMDDFDNVQGFHHKEGSRPVSQTIGIGENMIQITFNGTQTLQKKLLIFESHTFVCMAFHGI